MWTRWLFWPYRGELAKISGQLGFATTTDLDSVLADASVDLVDIRRCRMVLPLSAVVLLA
jgi:hypothetical protein